MSELKIFNRWGTENIKVDDPGLRPYITLNARIVPKTGARYAGNKFHKSNITIVERLINKVMIPGHKSKKHNKSSGHMTGKANVAYGIIEDSFRQIEARTKENPVAVFVKALENAAAREEIVTIEYGGARYPKAVECSPQRRIDLALRSMTQGAYAKSFNSKKSIVAALAEEIVAAYQCSPSSNAIAKKNELERQADASR
ncbi:30S ribosomal protein S7 [Candidatus Woesearchaeota archaeon]|nr:30S ribosomal protein S7 [Candidatus Woesearchaeota archaeon]